MTAKAEPVRRARPFRPAGRVWIGSLVLIVALGTGTWAAGTAGLGDLPLIVVSRGHWEPLPGVSTAENEQAWQAWQTMQAELATLSANGRQVIAEQSGHFIQLEQPELVIDAIREVAQTPRP